METRALSGISSILHINEKGGKFGGTEEYIASLANIVAPMGISSHLLYDGIHGSMASGIFHREIKGLGNRNGDSELGDRILRAVEEIDPDIVYVHNIFDGRAMKSLDKPGRNYLIIWYIHDHFPTCLTELRATREEVNIVCDRALSHACLSNIESGLCVKRHQDRTFSEKDLSARLELLASLRNADAIVVVSNYMKRVLSKNLPDIEDKIYVLPRQVRESQVESDRQNNKSPVIVFSGRITEEKGLHLAIEALGKLNIEREILFKIAGVVETENYWQRCLKLAENVERKNLAIKIEYQGHLSYQEVDALYAEADLVVVPSIWGEPLGAVAAEAMRNGAAVVASNVGGIDTWVIPEETGLLVEPDVDSLAEAIARLLSDSDLRDRLATTGQTLIKTKFTAKEHIKVFSEVIRDCHSVSPS